MLYLVSTPIGNLKDITFRAVEVLKSVDYVLCEDTRHSHKLFEAYGITTKRVSFHQFSEKSKEQSVIDDLKNGKSIALISDAGTPAIADPGENLVKRCVMDGIKVSPIPGPSAGIAALSASGLSTKQFQFVGFLPRKSGELKTLLAQITSFKGASICYESPTRIKKALETINESFPNLHLCIARELTKIYEEFISGSAAEILELLCNREVKGEIVLLIEPPKQTDQSPPSEEEIVSYVIRLQQTDGLTKKEAIAKTALELGVPKRIVYNTLIT